MPSDMNLGLTIKDDEDKLKQERELISSPMPAPTVPISQPSSSIPPLVAAPKAPQPVNMEPVATPALPTTQMPQEIVTGSETTTRQKVETPGMKKETANYNKAIADQQAAIQAKVAAEQEQAKSLANVEIEKQKFLKESQLKEDEARARFTAEAEARANKLAQDIEELKNTKFTDYWSDKSTAQKIVGAIAVGLGAYGAAMTGGGQNAAWTIMKDSMDRDMEKQKAQVDLRIKAIEQSKMSSEAKEKAAKMELDRLAAYKAASIEQAASKIDELKARFPGQVAQANADQLKAKLAEEAAAANRAYQSQLAADVETKTQKAMVYGTEGGMPTDKASMEQRNATIKEFEKANSDLIRANTEHAKNLENYKKASEKDKKSIGMGGLKAMYAGSMPTEALNEGDFARLAPELNPNFGKAIGKAADRAGQYGVGGAVAGAMVPGVGNVAGGVTGAVIGAASGFNEALGGEDIRFSPDYKAFERKMEEQNRKQKEMIRDNQAIIGLLKKGYTQAEAAEIVAKSKAGK